MEAQIQPAMHGGLLTVDADLLVMVSGVLVVLATNLYLAPQLLGQLLGFADQEHQALLILLILLLGVQLRGRARALTADGLTPARQEELLILAVQ